MLHIHFATAGDHVPSQVPLLQHPGYESWVSPVCVVHQATALLWSWFLSPAGHTCDMLCGLVQAFLSLEAASWVLDNPVTSVGLSCIAVGQGQWLHYKPIVFKILVSQRLQYLFIFLSVLWVLFHQLLDPLLQSTCLRGFPTLQVRQPPPCSGEVITALGRLLPQEEQLEQ